MTRPINRIEADIADMYAAYGGFGVRDDGRGGDILTPPDPAARRRYAELVDERNLALAEQTVRAARTSPARSARTNPARSSRKTFCPSCRTYGTPGSRCQCPKRSKAKPAARVRSVAENLAHFHAVEDRDRDRHPEGIVDAGYAAIRDSALRSIERRSGSLTPAAQDRLDALVRARTAESDGKLLARRIVATGTKAYESAFAKAMRHAHPAFTPEESRAVNAFREVEYAELRAAGESTSAAGGYGVPFMIDPTMILTGQDTAEVFGAARVVTITTSAWHGVSTPGTSYAFDAEATVVADGTPTLAQPTIPVYAAKSFIPASIELTQDYPGWLDGVTGLFASAYADNLSKYTAVGTGSAQPTGIFVSMSNQTTSPARVKVTTAGAIVGNDVRAALAALPERYQIGASWAMSPTVLEQVSALGAPSATAGLAPHDFVRMPGGQTLLMGRPVLQSSYAPGFTGTTAAANYLVVGDFSRFVIPVRAGLSVELIPQMLDFAGGTGRPTGERGYWSMVRYGSSVVDAAGFRLLANS